jgi:hypothetical protein
MPGMKAVLVMPNAIVGRQTASVLRCASLEVTVVPGAAQAIDLLAAQPALLLAPLTELKALQPAAQATSTRLLLWTDSDGKAALAAAASLPSICGIVGLRYPGAPPRSWEILAVARRLTAALPPPSVALAWGHAWSSRTLATTSDRDALVEEVERFATQVAPPPLVQVVAELAHELTMNAMYDAPVTASGEPRYADRRTERIDLEPHERPVLSFGSDGARLVVAASDPFGRLSRESVFGGMLRGLVAGSVDRRGGGAGLGMLLIHQAATVIFVDVIPGRLTQVTAILELDVSPRDLRAFPRSVHYWAHAASTPIPADQTSAQPPR